MAHDSEMESSSKKHYVEEPVHSFANDAKHATDKEQSMTLMQGIRLYPKAIGWSIVISTCIAMEGYDLCLLGNFCE
jgi:SP family general alpha glucoside:H+ symporter-like MFS transporter